MLPSRTKAAFLFTAEALWKPGGRVYFWTFTFAEIQSDWEGSAKFTAFLHDLRRLDWAEDVGGVKVAELHPGGHGIHFHALVNRRLNVNWVRQLARRHGIGRIHVEVADQNGGTAQYLSKYLSKSREGPLCESGRRMRRWAAFGPVYRCRCSDLVFHSSMWDYRRSHDRPFTKYRYEHLLSLAWDFGEDTFEFAWQAIKNGNIQDVMKCTVVAGYEVRREGPNGRLVLVERPEWRGRHRLPDLDPL